MLSIGGCGAYVGPAGLNALFVVAVDAHLFLFQQIKGPGAGAGERSLGRVSAKHEPVSPAARAAQSEIEAQLRLTRQGWRRCWRPHERVMPRRGIGHAHVDTGLKDTVHVHT